MKPLSAPVQQLPGHPGLLVQVEFTTSGYGVRATDGHSTWGEDLSRRRLLDRAEEVESPLDTDSSLHALLKRLQDGLTVSAAHVSVTLRRTGDKLRIETRDELDTDVFLHWHYNLRLVRADEAAAPSLVLSLAANLLFSRSVVRQLVEVVYAKEQALRQVQDKLRGLNQPAYRPPRAHAGFDEFSQAELDARCRRNAEHFGEKATVADILAQLSTAAQEPEYRHVWKGCTSQAASWEMKPLPIDAEIKPSPVTSAKKSGLGGIAPTLHRAGTSAEAAAIFKTPEKVRHRVKDVVHTKWSSPTGPQSSDHEHTASEPGTPSKTPKKIGAPSILDRIGGPPADDADDTGFDDVSDVDGKGPTQTMTSSPPRPPDTPKHNLSHNGKTKDDGKNGSKLESDDQDGSSTDSGEDEGLSPPRASQPQSQARVPETPRRGRGQVVDVIRTPQKRRQSASSSPSGRHDDDSSAQMPAPSQHRALSNEDKAAPPPSLTRDESTQSQSQSQVIDLAAERERAAAERRREAARIAAQPKRKVRRF